MHEGFMFKLNFIFCQVITLHPHMELTPQQKTITSIKFTATNMIAQITLKPVITKEKSVKSTHKTITRQPTSNRGMNIRIAKVIIGQGPPTLIQDHIR